jgi:hypothetical protein
MKCNYCSTEFISTNNRGAEQKYCSTKCRSKSANKRREQRLINSNNIQDEKENNRIRETIRKDNENNSEQSFQKPEIRRTDIFSNRIHSEYGNIEILEKLYESRNETIFYKLKCESLEKEIIELKLELEEIDNEEEDKYSGMLGGVMEQFKQDPVNTISFASELINNLFKPKL